MTREDALTAATRVIQHHRRDGYSSRELAEAILNVVGPLIRADENARWDSFADTLAQTVEERIRADLRAKVEALRDEAKSNDDFDQGWAGACREVLDLLDGDTR